MEKYQKYWDGDSSGWTIAESEHYILRGENEEASMYRKEDDKYITCVGDFYGEPNAGIIDKNERFCVTVGCGIIVYRLQEPFEGYMYDMDTPQWYEFGRGPENIDWMDAVRQLGPDEIELTDADGNHRILKIHI